MASKVTVTCELHGKLFKMKQKGETYTQLIERLIKDLRDYRS